MIKKLALDTSIYAIVSIATALINLLLLPIYTRFFTEHEFAIISLTSILIGLINIFISGGLISALQRFYWDDQVNKNKLVSNSLNIVCCLGILITLIIFLLSFLVKDYIFIKYQLPYKFLIFTILSFFPTSLIDFSLNYLRMSFQKTKFIILSLLNNICIALVPFLLLLVINNKLAAYFSGLLYAKVIIAIIALFFINKFNLLYFNLKQAINLLKFGYPLVFASLAYWIFGSLDRWLLAEISDISQVAYYTLAFKILTALNLVHTAFGQAWTPIAFQLAHDYPNYYHKTFGKTLTIWFFILLSVAIGINIFSLEIILLLAPRSYLSAVILIPFLSMGLVFYGTTQITAIGISLKNQTYLIGLGSWMTAIINSILNIYLITLFQALGAAITNFISFLILTLFYYYHSKKLINLKIEKTKILFLFFSSIIILIISIFLNLQVTQFVLKFFYIKCSLVLIYLLLSLYFKIISLDQIKTIIHKPILILTNKLNRR